MTLKRLQDALWPSCSWQEAGRKVVKSFIPGYMYKDISHPYDEFDISDPRYGGALPRIEKQTPPDIVSYIFRHEAPLTVARLIESLNIAGYRYFDDIPAVVFEDKIRAADYERILYDMYDSLWAPPAHQAELILEQLVKVNYRSIKDIGPVALRDVIERSAGAGYAGRSPLDLLEILDRIGYQHRLDLSPDAIRKLIASDSFEDEDVTALLQVLRRLNYDSFDAIPGWVFENRLKEPSPSGARKFKKTHGGGLTDVEEWAELIRVLSDLGYSHLDQVRNALPKKARELIDLLNSEYSRVA